MANIMTGVSKTQGRLFDLASQATEIIEDPAWQPSSVPIVLERRMKRIVAEIGSICLFNVTELYHLRRKFPKRDQWVHGSLAEMLRKLMEEICAADKARKATRRRRRCAAVN
jgi:hypothetical protein